MDIYFLLLPRFRVELLVCFDLFILELLSRHLLSTELFVTVFPERRRSIVFKYMIPKGIGNSNKSPANLDNNLRNWITQMHRGIIESPSQEESLH